MVEKIKRVALDEGPSVRFVACVMRKSARAKRISLRVASFDKAILTLPRWSTWKSGYSFLSQEQEWLKEKTGNYPIIPSLSEYFSRGGELWLDQHPRKLDWDRKKDCRKSFYAVEKDVVSVRLSGKTDLEDELLEVCRSLARSSLTTRLQSIGEKNDLAWSKVRIGNQRSRWGSCSQSGAISLNWRLILLPCELGDYVLCHELAHLKHLNHSVAFWQFLEQIVHGSKALDRRLRVEGKFAMGLARRD